MPSKFVHLHTHTHYSLLDGMTKIPDLVAKAKELGMTAVAMTDHGNLYGAVEFYKECTKAGIKPILGVEAYIASGDHKEKNTGTGESNYYHLILLVKNETGWKNLLQLVTQSWLEGFYYRPRMDKEMLRKHHEGLIALSGCLSGEVAKALQANRPADAEKIALEWQEIFGKENYYIELQNHKNIAPVREVLPKQIALAKKLGIPMVATGDSHYLNTDDREVHDILLAIQTGKTVNDPKKFVLEDDFSFKPGEVMEKLFPDVPEAIENTAKIAEMCNFKLELGKILLPKFDTPDGSDSMLYLRKLVAERTAERYPIVDEITAKRITYELTIIEKMGFPDYFLIVQDFINWAKDRGVVVGPGRGSAAGSIISYILKITDLDPIHYDLLFERFLNPERIQMPDIDVDITDVRRDEVFGYLTEKYGADRVAHIITFGTMAARAAIRDVGRALDIELAFCDRLAKLIPFGKDLQESLDEVAELAEFYKTDERAKKIINAAKKLEGVARHASVHACGTVIAAEPLPKRVPLQHAPQDENVTLTQFEMHAIEDLGLLKMDILGLKNLTIIEDTIRLVADTRDERIVLDKIPLDDKQAFALFQRADTVGIFQLESGGIRRYLKELKPTNLEDIIAMVALYRPGPMELIPSYINRKHGKEIVTYLHPKMEPIMGKTFGIGIYQEQMMRIASDMASYTLAEADTLRKAIGKKIKKLLDEQEVKLIAGLIKNGIPERTARQIWELFPPFARYGFNRCLTGNTRIQNPKTGELITVKELFENRSRTKQTLSLNEETLKTYKNTITDVVDNGIKPVFELKTRSGRKITATGNHPFYTTSGWQNLETLKLGDRLATPRALPEPEKPLTVEPHKLVLLGYILSEGNLCHPHGFYYYANDPVEVADYCKALSAFKNTQPTIDRRKTATAVYSRRTSLRESSEAVEWITSLGMKYKKATEKTFPAFVFQLSNQDLSLLIAKMFQGDGCINDKRENAQIFYATSSAMIARDMQHLLLRLNVLSTIHTKKFKYRGGVKIGYTIAINRYDNIKNFLEVTIPHLVGRKQKTAERILADHPIINGSLKTWAARGSKDIIPVSLVMAPLREAALATVGGFAPAATRFGFSEHFFHQDIRKKGYLREMVGKIASDLQSERLEDLAASDIYWDEIIAINPAGTAQTYDLTMEKDHNFVANDIFVHNSHAACYAMIAYRTAYLKARYPTEFMTALLNSESSDVERIGSLIGECKKMGVQVLPPDINKSQQKFSPEGGNIRFGLDAIKNVGSNIVGAIIETRSSGGPFANFSDLCTRVQHKDLNKKSLESLTKCGALDSFGIERNTIIQSLDEITKFAQAARKTAGAGQGTSLFGSSFVSTAAPKALQLKPAEPATKKDKLAWEKELLGLYVSDHPLSVANENGAVAALKPTRIKDVLAEKSTVKNYRICGMVASVKAIITKTGKPMCFARVEDQSGALEVVVFSETYAKNLPCWKDGAVIVCVGRLNFRNGEISLVADQVKEIS